MIQRAGRSLIAVALVAAGVALAFSPAAGAETHSATVAAQSTDWTDTVAVPRFDPAQGVLQRVDVTLSGRVEGDLRYENLAGAETNVQATLGARLQASRPDLSLIVSVQPTTAHADTLGPYDGTTDYSGSSGTERLGLDASATTSIPLSDLADLALFTGTGSLLLPIAGIGTSSVTPAATTQSSIVTRAGLEITVEYHFVADNRAPDPPTFSDHPPAFTNDEDPIIAFGVNESGLTTECRLAGPAGELEPWAPCASPWTTDLSSSLDGSHTFAVRATDAAGNVGGSATATFTLDRVAPGEPTFTTTPVTPGRSTAPVWAFEHEAGATATCSLDGGPAAPCAGTYTAPLSGALDGLHSLVVQVQDAAGNTAPPVTGTYLLDRAAPPRPVITAEPASPSNDPTPSWSFTAVDGATACAIDAGAYTACTHSFTASLDLALDGAHTFSVRATDEAGNIGEPAVSTYTLDRTSPAAPSISAPASPSNDLEPSWDLAAEAGATLECRFDASPIWSPCAGTYSVTLTAADEGVHSLSARATDIAGNRGPTATSSFELDVTAPLAPAITAAPARHSADDTPTWTFSAETGAELECAVNDAPWSACSDSLTADLTAARDGRYTFAVRATDLAGNTGPLASTSFILDRSAPALPSITSSPPSPGRSSTPTWTFDSPADAASTSCSVDGAPWVPCAGSFTADLTSAADGAHTIAIRATDPAGNRSAAAMGSYLLDRIAPAAPVLTAQPPSPGNVTTPQWSFTAEAGAVAQCSLDGGVWVACALTFTANLTGAADGTHTFAVRAVDAAGNVGAETTDDYDLDATAPAAPAIVDAPANHSPDDSPTWTFTVEPGVTTECRVDGGPWLPCEGSVTPDLSGGLDGTHAVEVRAADGVGNVGDSVTASYVLDRSPPATPTFMATPVSPGQDRTPTWVFTIEAGSTALCSLDSGPWRACDSTITGQFRAGETEHIVRVRAVDAAGNEGPTATSRYLLDTVPPPPPAVTAPPSPGNDTSPEWTLVLRPGERAECRLDGGPFQPCGSVFTVELAGFDGTHVLEVRAKDGAGNASTTVSSPYVLDTTAPAPPTIDRTPRGGAWSWAFTVEPGARAECSLGGGPWFVCVSPMAAAQSSDEVRLEVRAFDLAGNRSAVTGTTVRPSTAAPEEPAPTHIAPNGPAITPRTPSTFGPPPVPAEVAAVPAPAAVASVETSEVAAPPIVAGRAVSTAEIRRDPETSFAGPAVELLGAAVSKTTIPLVLILLITGFVAVQNRIDRRDPKLANAPLRREPEYMEFR